LESVCRGNSTVGSNPTLSAMSRTIRGVVYAGPALTSSIEETQRVRTNVLTFVNRIATIDRNRPPMRFEWDENKNRQNFRKHDVRFESAILIFDDQHAFTQRDLNFDEEERWITVGAMEPGSVLFVVHTYLEVAGEEIVRVISARAAESHERKAYEEAYKRSAPRHSRHRGKKRRRH
jgi:uncharacterized protein